MQAIESLHDDIESDPGLGAAPQQHVRRALGDHDEGIVALVVDCDHRHHLAFGRERHLRDALEAAVAALMNAELALGDKKGRLGRIALDLPDPVCGLAEVGIAGEATAGEHDDMLRVHRP